jgi:hypothetical protein
MLRFVRILAIPTALMGLLAICDVLCAPSESDVATVTNMYVSQGKSGGNYLQAQGRYWYNEAVPARFYQNCRVGDTVKVALTPLFRQWRHAELIRTGQTVASAAGKVIWLQPLFGVLFVLPCLFFIVPPQPGGLEGRSRQLCKAAIAAEIVALILWAKFALMALGIAERM